MSFRTALALVLLPGLSLFAQNAVYTNSPSPYTTTGVLAVADPATPDISEKLGTATSSSSFTVFNVNNEALFRVRGNGTALLTRDHNAATIFEINNPNAGLSATSSLRFTDASGNKAVLTSYGSGSSWLPNGLSIFNASSTGILNFGTNNAEKMRIYPNGEVAINGTGPNGYGSRLFVQHGVDNSKALFVSHQPAFEAGSPAQTDYAAYIQATTNVHAGVTNAGSMTALLSFARLAGPGTLANAYGGILEVGVSDPSGTLTNAYGAVLKSTRVTGATITNGFALYIQDVLANTDWGIYQAASSDDNYFAGRVGIGTTALTATLEVNGSAKISGDLTVDGNIGAKYQDLAEWVPASQDMLPGTVVVLDPKVNNQVMPSHRSYDTTVAGVVSEQPGVILGVGGPDKEQVATTGRVKVRVDATRGPVAIGDILVTSDRPGMAMKSQPVDISGIAFHRPGTVIGKALEPLVNGEGEILVLLSLQ